MTTDEPNADFDYAQVQETACPLCGHDTAAVPAGDLPSALVDGGRQWAEFISAVLDYPGGGDDLRRRPRPETWSAIEYACHVRDVLSLFARRVELTLLADTPEYGWWDHEAAVSEDHYAEQHPRAVIDDIETATLDLARLVQPLGPQALARAGTRLGTPFTAVGLVRFALHEVLHHLDDARAVVPAPSA